MFNTKLLFTYLALFSLDYVSSDEGDDILKKASLIPFQMPYGTVPTIDEFQKMIEDSCMKTIEEGGVQSTSLTPKEQVQMIRKAREEFVQCVKGLEINIDTLQSEIDVARPTGDLDSVFKKYCLKVPQLRGCISDMMGALDYCIVGNQLTNKEILSNMTLSLMNFICFKDGDRIAMFIAEEGPECLGSKFDQMQECLNKTMEKYDFETLDFGNFSFNEHECKELNQLELCIITELEKCSQPTPANIVESLIKVMRKSTPCKMYPSALSAPGSGLTIVASTFSFLSPLIALLLSRL